MKRYAPPKIVEIIAPAEFVDDEDMQWRIVEDRMMRDYASVLVICCLLLIVVVII